MSAVQTHLVRLKGRRKPDCSSDLGVTQRRRAARKAEREPDRSVLPVREDRKRSDNAALRDACIASPRADEFAGV